MYDSNPTLDFKIQPDYESLHGEKNFYIESDGCQMNGSDSEIVASI